MKEERKGRVEKVLEVVEVLPSKLYNPTLLAKGYERLALLSLQTVFDNLGKSLSINGKDVPPIKLNSKRYYCYARKGVTCVRCGIKGQYFAVERQGMSGYHLNLYHLTKGDNEIMITIDHILPRSRGGGNEPSNLQAMCIECNHEKGNLTEEELKLPHTRNVYDRRLNYDPSVIRMGKGDLVWIKAGSDGGEQIG